MTTLLVRLQAMHQAQSVQRHTSALLDSWRNMGPNNKLAQDPLC